MSIHIVHDSKTVQFIKKTSQWTASTPCHTCRDGSSKRRRNARRQSRFQMPNSCCLHRLDIFQFSTKNPVPETTRYTKPILIICKVMLEMVLLQFTIVRGQTTVVSRVQAQTGYNNSLAMMKEVVGQVIADITEDTTAECCCCSIPIVEEDCMSQLPKGSSEHKEHCGWHDESVLIHRQVMMDSVEEEVESDPNAVVW